MKVVNLLIVDDHPVVRDGLKMMLESNRERFDFKVSQASNSSEALAMISNSNFDVVIMDYSLPDKTGDVITKEVLEIKKDSKIIGLSNFDEAKDHRSEQPSISRNHEEVNTFRNNHFHLA